MSPLVSLSPMDLAQIQRPAQTRPMSKRPVSVTVVAGIFMAAGVMGFVYHVSEFKSSFEFELVWVCLLRLLAIVGGVFLLRGDNWARWLLLIWMAYHVILSAFHSPVELVMHSVLLVVIVYVLFRPRASAYFRRASRTI